MRNTYFLNANSISPDEEGPQLRNIRIKTKEMKGCSPDLATCSSIGSHI
jgi:hypothetical protein